MSYFFVVEPKPITTKIVHYITKKPTADKKQKHKQHARKHHQKTHVKNKQSKAFFKTGQETQNVEQQVSHVVSLPFANARKSNEEVEAEEEEILKKYGSKESEEENDAEPGAMSAEYVFFCVVETQRIYNTMVYYCIEHFLFLPVTRVVDLSRKLFFEIFLICSSFTLTIFILLRGFFVFICIECLVKLA